MAENITNEELNEQVEDTIDDAAVMQVPIDATLKISGEAADAAAVGRALAEKADKSDTKISVNGQEADNQGLILLDAGDIPLEEGGETTVAGKIEDIAGKTGADIPLSGEEGAESIQAAILTIRGKTAQDILMESGGEKTIAETLEEMDLSGVVRRINQEYTPDENGDVTVERVPYADNLWSEDTDEADGEFRIRTTGGSRSISSGSAQIKRICGNRIHEGYVPEEFSMTVIAPRAAPADITAEVDSETFIAKAGETGTYTFSYTQGEWSRDPDEWGVTVTGEPIEGDLITVYYGPAEDEEENTVVITVTPADRAAPLPIAATADMSIFRARMTSSGTLNMVYTTGWNVEPSYYGITVTGEAKSGDEIRIVYVKETRGTITQADFGILTATGWNLYNHTVGYARVVKYSEKYGYKIGGDYLSVTFSKTVDGTQTAVSPDEDGLFQIETDGYVHVTGGNSTNTYILTTWSDKTEGMDEWEAYKESRADLSGLMDSIFPYGLMRVGDTKDEIDFDTKTAISRVLRMEYNAENLTAARASGREYEYDEDYIYIVRENAVETPFTAENGYEASEYGIEFFNGDGIEVYTEIRYGQNLKDKLRRDVITYGMTVSEVLEMG